MSKAWDGGSTRRWRAVRAYVLQRDGYLCQVRLPGVCTVAAPARGGHAHHLHGKGACVGCAADRPSHIVATCEACNLKIGDPSRGQDRKNEAVTRW